MGAVDLDRLLAEAEVVGYDLVRLAGDHELEGTKLHPDDGENRLCTDLLDQDVAGERQGAHGQ